MPQQRPNFYGLTDQQRADQAFLEKARSRSPKFPDVVEAMERRARLRETIVARTMGVLCLAGLVVAYWDSFGWVIAGVNAVGFVITCFVAGNRQYERTGLQSPRRGQRPF